MLNTNLEYHCFTVQKPYTKIRKCWKTGKITLAIASCGKIQKADFIDLSPRN